MTHQADGSPRGVRLWLVAVIVLALVLVGSGWIYYRWQAGILRAQAARQLTAVAQLKADELSAWRRERLSDARFYSNNLALARLVARALGPTPDPEAMLSLQSWFSDTQQSHGYGVFIVDRSGQVRLSLPESQPPLGDALSARAADVAASGQVEIVDFYQADRRGQVHLAVVMPLRAPEDDAGPQAALVWRLDPATNIYPILKRWPVESATAEVVLTRRTDEGVVVLNPTAARPIVDLYDYIPFDRSTLPSVRAALGDTGIIEADNVQGTPVLAVALAVAGTPWALAAQVHQDEIFAPLGGLLRSTVAVTGALLLALVTAAGLLRREETARYIEAQLRAETRLRVQAEALHDADELLRFHVENSPLAMIEWDTSFRVVNWSARAEAMFGWPAQEVVGRRPDEWGFVHPDDVVSVNAIIGDLLAGSVPRNASLNRNVTRDGRVLHCEWYNSIRLDAVGGRSSILSLAQDVSDRVRAEEALRTLNSELEQRVTARTAELEAKNRELEVFTYSVSHDLKAPLRGIDGYSRLLVDDHAASLDDEARLFLQNIRQAAANMGRLIDDLLSYSRLERRPMQRTPSSLPALVERLLADRALDMQARGVVVTRDLPDTPVNVDVPSLTMALANLIDNALKFSGDAHPPSLNIGASVTPAGTHIWVRDNGVGFDMKYSERIFDIFHRLHRAEEYPGTGIGLAIVRKSMERVGGRAWAESRPGEGATFHLELPA